MLANLVGWIATIFRASGMIARRADLVKYLVSVGNILWLINGILTHNAPLIASNAICVAVWAWELIVKKVKQNKNK